MKNVIGFIFGLWVWIKAIAFWLLIKENRRIGIMNTKKALDVFIFVSKLTKNKRDDFAAAYIAKQFSRAFYDFSFNRGVVNKETAEIAANEITKSQDGLLKDVSIALDEGKVKAGIGNIVSSYDPSNNRIELNINRF
jgi:hypothetical protein